MMSSYLTNYSDKGRDGHENAKDLHAYLTDEGFVREFE